MSDSILFTFTGGAVFLLAFITVANPRKVNVGGNVWLGIFLFAFGCAAMDRAISSVSPFAWQERVVVFLELSRFALAPALYLSVLNFTSPGRKFERWDYLHFVPFFLFAVYSLPFLFSYHLPAPALPRMMAHVLGSVMSYSVKIQVVVYWLLAYQRLTRHAKNVKRYVSTPETFDLHWLLYFLWAVVFMVMLWFNELFFGVEAIRAVAPLGYLAAVYFIAFFSLQQKEVFPFDRREVQNLQAILEEDPATAARSQRLSPEAVDALKTKLLALMEHEKIFRDQALDLPSLATRMEVSSHDLSYVLNAGFGESFFQFVNAYRVAEAKALLRSEKHRHLSVLGIAFEAGFNSKTTFNITFKKFTGMSPTQFQKSGQS